MSTASESESLTVPKKDDELSVLSSDPSEAFALSSGQLVRVARLKTRETLALLRILTRGAGDVLAQTRLTEDMGAEEFVGVFVGSVILSIPEAEEETIDFIRRMVLPEDYITSPRTSAETRANAESLQALLDSLKNPELEDTVAILEKVIRVEAEHIIALGKRLASLLAAQNPLKSQRKSKTSTQSTEPQ